MATTTSLPAVLADFTAATESAISSLPDPAVLIPPENGITLLDAKNEIFLAYLQALALRNLSVIRALKDGGARGIASDSARKLSDDLTRKLVEHRAYLERGVRSLEGKIKYQVDKVVLAAEDAERGAAAAQKAKLRALTNGRAKGGSKNGSDEDSDDSDDSEDSDAIAASTHRANAANFAHPRQAADDSAAKRSSKAREDGVYRPPRVSATSMPMPESRDRKADRRRPARSATLDEYIATELSTAPAAQPSIGSTIDAGGRRQKDARQLAKEQERRDYEETNLVRLPAESRKERARLAARDRSRGGFGGEEWRGLGDSLDRIGDLTRSKKGRESVLDKSRKRPRAIEDGPRGDGMGDAFEARKKRMVARKGRR